MSALTFKKEHSFNLVTFHHEGNEIGHFQINENHEIEFVSNSTDQCVRIFFELLKNRIDEYRDQVTQEIEEEFNNV